MNIPAGRNDIAQLFSNSLNADRLSQSYIIKGDSGMGKKTILEYILHLMMCENHTACGKCMSCKSIDADTHPDIIRLKRPEGRASIGVDSVRNLMAEIYVKPIMSDYKAVVIYEAHFLTPEAQNSMLKIIEEPPEKVVFFLLCDTTTFILPTVISRSVIIDLKPLSKKVLKEIDNDNLTDFELYYCQGNPGKLKKIINDNKFNDLRDSAIDAFSSIISEDNFAIFKALTFFEKNKDIQNEIFNIILLFIRDVLYKKLGMDEYLVNKDKINYINAFEAKASAKSCYNIMGTVLDIQRDKGKNGNYTIVTSMMLIKCREEING